VREVAKAVRSTARNLEALATAPDPIARVLGTDLSGAASEQRTAKAQATSFSWVSSLNAPVPIVAL
jgi:hypothetical protein